MERYRRHTATRGGILSLGGRGKGDVDRVGIIRDIAVTAGRKYIDGVIKAHGWVVVGPSGTGFRVLY